MLDVLKSLLSLYPAAVRPLSDPEALGHAGGLSGSLLWRYVTGRGRYLIRAWPPDGPPKAALERVHAWLAEAGALGFLPVPVAALDGRTLHERVGRFWEVVPWLEGETEDQRPPRPARVRTAFAALAAFHQRLARPRSRGTSPGIVSRWSELAGLRQGGFAAVEGALRVAPAGQAADLARRWHRAASDLAPGLVERLRGAAGLAVSLQPCLRDARPEHFLFQGDRVTGLLDFGAMAEDSVAADLARLNAEWLGHDAALRAEALHAYNEVRPLDPAELAIVSVYEDAGSVLVGWHWVRWHFLEGRVFDDPAAVVSGLEKGLERVLTLACPGGITLK